MNISEGNFIVFEGGDGSGQDTQAELLRKYLESVGFDVIKTNEPTDGDTGKEIRKILGGIIPNPGALELQELMVADRKEHLQNEIIPHLSKKGVVICVRYLYSTLAYGQADGLDYSTLWDLNKDFLRPDLTIYLDLDPKISLERVKERASKTGQALDIFEKETFLTKVRDNFLVMQEVFSEMVIIDALGSPDEVFQKIQVCVIDC